ncbi:threonine synthase-like 2 isoform X2 [Neopelma chrysocephalum]|uniref:threonine synthase-like 2 isoform X2 n=1 Tax=Neopelma chrysocephalum TaxID=114329 RepID=UPI000FCD07A7|nr:threonine synthase-like 2 isoform X2 [Neopelma chrysocephalum]
MEYISTRGGTGAVDFEGALFSGYAPDGGLFMPQNIPSLDRDTLRRWSSLCYRGLVKELCSLFIPADLVPRNTLSGTSGDTGSSAIESVRGQKNMDIFVLLPKGLCTQIQELQMTTVIEDNVHVFAAHGNSDEIDEPIKELFADDNFARKYNLMSLNSINWSRIMVQIAHYFYAYFQCAPSLDTTPLPVVEIVVPTGGGGNITAGCIAQKMGLPIRVVAVVNSNDIIHRTVQHGDFSVAENVKATLASAMDIQEPYNVERILWLLSGSDSSLIKTLMEQFSVSKSLKLPEDLHRKLSETLRSCSASDEDIVGAMRRCWEENQYLLCPHSAVAAHYHYSQPDGIPRCCLAPASAAKFQDAVLRAGLVPQIVPEITALTKMETRSTPLERGQDWAQVLRGRIGAVARQWEAGGGQFAPLGQQGIRGQVVTQT